MRIIYLWCFMWMAGIGQAQYFNMPALNQFTLEQIDSIANDHFRQSGSGKGTGFKQYMRWRNEMAIKTDRGGLISNFDAHTARAFKLLQSPDNNERASNGQWYSAGPHNLSLSDPQAGNNIGRVNCMAFHPSNPDIFYAGTAFGGLWKTVNGGDSWTPLTDAMITNGISDIAIHPEFPETIYVVTGDTDGSQNFYTGIFRSTDGGLNWGPRMLSASQTSAVKGYRLVIHPTNPNILVVAFENISHGIYFTYNGGQTWATRLPGQAVTDIDFSPVEPHRFYAGTKTGFYYTDDLNAVNWPQVTDPDLPTMDCRKAIALSPSEPDHLYLLYAGVPDTGMFNGLYKSTDNGLTFTKQSDSPNIYSGDEEGDGDYHQSWYDLTLLVHPTNDSIVFVGAVNQWKSTNEGITWTRTTRPSRGGGSVNPYVHADWHNNYFNNSKQYACVDGGIFVLEEGETIWTDITPGMAITQFYNIDVAYGKAMGGSQDNGTLEVILPSTTATEVLCCDGFGNLYHPTNPDIQFTSDQNGIVKTENGVPDAMWRENNGFWYTRFYMSTDGDPDSIFVLKGKNLYKANHTPEPENIIWEDKNTQPNLPEGWQIRAFAQAADDPGLGYVLNHKHFIKTTTLRTATPLWSEVTTPVLTAHYSDVILSPENADRIWLTCGSYIEDEKVFFSPDGGETWTNLSVGLPNIPIRCIVLDTSSTNESIYIGTEFGVFYRNNTMSSWVNYSSYLPATAVNELVIYEGNIYAGTFGRGMWKSELFSCPTALNLTPGNDPVDPENLGYQEFRASSHITSTRVIGGSFSDVRYAAENYIDLKPGFLAKSTGIFNAVIEGCPD